MTNRIDWAKLKKVLEDLPTIIANVKADRGITYEQISDESGVSISIISRFVNRTHHISLGTILSLVSWLEEVYKNEPLSYARRFPKTSSSDEESSVSYR